MRHLAAAVLAGGRLWGATAVQAAGVNVDIVGIEGALRDNVRAFLGIVQYTPRGDAEADAAMVRRLHARAPGEIRNALQPFGYYDPEIRARLERSDDGWRARYEVDPGTPVRLDEVTLRVTGAAADDPAFDERVAELPLAAGQQLNHADYETAKRRLMELAAERGYVEARWAESTLRIDPDAGSARARLVLASGPRYRFGEVRFDTTVVSETFLRRYLRFAPGEPFVAARLLELQYALDDSDYFRRVDVRARREQAADGRIPVEVALAARAKHRYTLGLGYGTDTGGRVSVGRESRWVNDRGHRFQAQLRVAEISARVSARYTIPLAQPWRERLEISSAYGREDIGGGRSTQFELGARRLTTSGGWQRALSLEYERSRDEIGGEVTTRNLVMPGIALTRSRYDDRVYARRGYRLGAELNGGSETLGSDVSFLRLRTQASGVRGLWAGARLLGRLELGRVWVEGFDDLPLSQRFFAGGDQSVRGFDYQALGPTNAQGEVVGGRYLAVASIELEQLVAGNWGAAVFVDHGNALAEPGDDLRTAAGVGLRYRSPVGVFRIDVARATDGDESARLHLGLGVDL
ncbi:MAG: autotransporter assembly complex family protein [Halofilum sp. (in: g-proteobacteria)]|nr:autotransporter assembly complex family protein [Halofilum sp. (in: g-proteobacteria)]